jgi:hypothetical protein
MEELVKDYQKKNQLTETGIADLVLRQQLDEKPKKVIGQTIKPTATPTVKPTIKPKAKLTIKLTATPSTTPSVESTTTP